MSVNGNEVLRRGERMSDDAAVAGHSERDPRSAAQFWADTVTSWRGRCRWSDSDPDVFDASGDESEASSERNCDDRFHTCARVLGMPSPKGEVPSLDEERAGKDPHSAIRYLVKHFLGRPLSAADIPYTAAPTGGAGGSVCTLSIPSWDLTVRGGIGKSKRLAKHLAFSAALHSYARWLEGAGVD